MTSNLQQRVGANLRSHRESRGLSQEKFAAIVGVHFSYISDIERGQSNITLGTLERIAAAAGVHPLELLAPLDD